MGEIAEMMLDGTLCEGCGVYIGQNNGIPGYCGGCSREAKVVRKSENIARHTADQAASKKIACTVCGRKVKTIGMPNHLKDAHGTAAKEAA